jgi:hypothetical protein
MDPRQDCYAAIGCRFAFNAEIVDGNIDIDLSHKVNEAGEGHLAIDHELDQGSKEPAHSIVQGRRSLRHDRHVPMATPFPLRGHNTHIVPIDQLDLGCSILDARLSSLAQAATPMTSLRKAADWGYGRVRTRWPSDAE